MSEQILLLDLERLGLVELGRGDIISKIDMEACPGNYPVYSSSASGDGKFGEYGKFIFNEELISWSIDGGGHFFYRPKHQFSVTNVSGYMRAKGTGLNLKYLFYALTNEHKFLTFDYMTKAHPSVIRKLYKVPFPSLNAQKKVAEILSTIDAEIVQTEALIAKWQKIKAGMMQDLFTRGVTPDGHLRPTYAEAPHLYKDSPLGWIPKEWVDCPIDAIGNVVTGNTPPEECFEADGNGIAFITPGDIGQSPEIKTTERSLRSLSLTFARSIPAGAICVVCIGSTIGKIGLAKNKSVTNQQINSVICFKDELSSFYRYSMEFYLPSQLRREVGLQAVPIVKKSSFQKLRLAHPTDQQEREKIMGMLDAAGKEIDVEIDLKNKLVNKKSGLMHDLLTGRVRVAVPDDEKDAA